MALSGSTTVRSMRLMVRVVSSSMVMTAWPVMVGGTFTCGPLEELPPWELESMTLPELVSPEDAWLELAPRLEVAVLEVAVPDAALLLVSTALVLLTSLEEDTPEDDVTVALDPPPALLLPTRDDATMLVDTPPLLEELAMPVLEEPMSPLPVFPEEELVPSKPGWAVQLANARVTKASASGWMKARV